LLTISSALLLLLLQEIRGNESSYEEDMAEPQEGAVWLLGEQRWSRPVNGTS
jgi:hypothetical protein